MSAKLWFIFFARGSRQQRKKEVEAQMDMRPYLIEVVFDDGWKIEFEGTKFGPYASRSDAMATANRWVENGRRQGHDVTLTVRGAAAKAVDDNHRAPDGRAA
jgi:hypothetical protein